MSRRRKRLSFRAHARAQLNGRLVSSGLAIAEFFTNIHSYVVADLNADGDADNGADRVSDDSSDGDSDHCSDRGPNRCCYEVSDGSAYTDEVAFADSDCVVHSDRDSDCRSDGDAHERRLHTEGQRKPDQPYGHDHILWLPR